MSTIYESAKNGQPLKDVLIIDSHCHMGFWKQFHAPKNNAEGMLENMDMLGIDKAFVAPNAAIGPDYIFGNNVIIDALERYPDRFIGYVTVNPNYEDDMKNELDRCFKVKGMKGIKLHPSLHGTPIDYKNYRYAYETANERKCPLLIHTWGYSDVAVIDKLSAKYPDAQFIIGHSGADPHAMAYAIDIVKSRENAYLDLAISFTYEGNVEWFVREVSSKKVLFGSDMPFFDPRPALGRVAMARISDAEKRDVFGLNMELVLKKCM